MTLLHRLMVVLFFVLLTPCLGQSASQVQTDYIWKTANHDSSLQPLDLSVYISNSSPWDHNEIKQRLERANQVLQTCQISIRNVYFNKWILSSQKLRVDDTEDNEVFYDGMRHAANKALALTPIQLFYFNDYSNPFTYGGSVPLAVFDEERFPDTLINTAWFPYYSAQRRKGFEAYSEEAHEIGHILLQDGHDHSGEPNIMANNSALRTAFFDLEKQCPQLNLPAQNFENIRCRQSATDLFPIFKSYFVTYSDKSYMSTWCSRNSDNLQKGIRALDIVPTENIHAIYVKHKIEGESLYPKEPRDGSRSWAYHAFLLIDGIVFDMDHGTQAQLNELKAYLENMWGEKSEEFLFQVRGADQMQGYTRIEVYETFEKENFPVYTKDEFLLWAKTSTCNSTPAL